MSGTVIQGKVNESADKLINIFKNQDASFFMSFDEGGTTVILCLLIFQSTVITLSGVVVLGVTFTDKKLRTQPQCLCIANLSLCGLIAGCFITPFNIPFILYHGHAWEYGRNLCKVWLVFDNVVTTEMPLAVFIIMYDRFLFAKSKLNYLYQETVRRCVLRIAVSWMWCFCLYGPVIILWDIVQGYSEHEIFECTEEYNENVPVRTALTLLEMIVPATLLSYYSLKLCMIFKKKKRIRAKRKIEVLTLSNHYYRKQCKTSLNFGKALVEGVVIYVLFWWPYIIFFILRPFLNNEDQLDFEGESVYWFNVAGYMVHPYLFALTCPSFSKKLGFILTTFIKYMKAIWALVKCRKHTKTKRLRLDFQLPIVRIKKKLTNSRAIIHP